LFHKLAGFEQATPKRIQLRPKNRAGPRPPRISWSGGQPFWGLPFTL